MPQATNEGATPPPATMMVGDARVAGELGTWSQPGGGDSVPWLPADALGTTVEVGAGEIVTISMPTDSLDGWQAVYAPADDPSPERPLSLGSAEAEGGPRAFVLPGLPTGDWVVMVEIDYTEGGSGAYYWHIRRAP